MKRLQVSLMGAALILLGCPGAEPDTDAGVDAGPVVCVDFPERLDADYTVAEGCWLVKQTPTLADGITLTVSPGAKLVFSPETQLAVRSDVVLQAVGTEAKPILFTGATAVRGAWRGLRFDGNQQQSHLAFVTIEYAGDTSADAEAAALKLTADSRGARVGLSHCTLRESQGYGLWATGSVVFSEFAANVLTHNALGPLSLDSNSVGALDTASSYTGNDVDEVTVRASRISQDATWPDPGEPYHLTAALRVDQGTLTLAAGARLILPADTGLTVSGDDAALVAVGTAAAPVVFTGETQTRGAWNGLVFDGSNNALNRLAYVRVEYGGSTTSHADGACVRLISDSHGVRAGFDHVTLRDCQGYGLRAGGSAVLSPFTSSTLTANGLGAALVDSNAAAQLDATSVYSGNDVDRVFVDGTWVAGGAVWKALEVPYSFVGTSLRPQGVWTLSAGLTLEMGPQSRIDVGGDEVGLHAAGTATAPVTITGATKTAGSWDGIVFDTTNNAANRLESCVVEYGGGGARFGWHAMVNSQSDSHGVTVAVTHSTIRHSASWGVWFNAAQTGEVSDNTYADNAAGDYFHEP